MVGLMEGNVEVNIESSVSNAIEWDTIFSKGSDESVEVTHEGVHVVLDVHSGMECSDHLGFEEKGYPKEKRLKPYSNKHSKPPRPPKGPLLNSSDLLLVREISELAVKKRQKIDKKRALKKMKAARGSSCRGSIIAMVMTIVFFIIIVLQGVCSRGGIQIGFQGSPELSAANKGLISLQFFSKRPINEIYGPIDHHSKSEESASGSLSLGEEGRDAQ